jgi:hypothetical protein
MKKTVLFTALLASSVLLNAQEKKEEEILKNKKGHEILPAKGDIALGVNVVPVFDLLLNTLNHVSLQGGSAGTSTNTAANTIQYTSNANNQIVGKYFLDPKTAIRVRFGFNTLSGTITNKVQDAGAMYTALQSGSPDDVSAASLIKVDDKLKFNKSNVMVSVGYEKRRGYRRLVGVYGVEIGVGRTNASQSATYGNAFSDQYQTFYTDNFNALSTATLSPSTPTRVSRNLETKYGNAWRFGARAFVGIEYFVFSKISIGAEFGWGYSVTTQKGGTTKDEVFFNGQNGPTVVTESKPLSGSSNTKGFAIDNNNGSTFSMNNTLNGNTLLNGGSAAIMLIFHF